MKNALQSGARSQLDLTLPEPPPTPPRSRRTTRPCSRERAAWWFRQMHRVIADDSHPVQATRMH